MNPEIKSSAKPAWVLLYEARRPTPLARTRSRGRPPRVTPRKATVIHLTDGERMELNTWQERAGTAIICNASMPGAWGCRMETL